MDRFQSLLAWIIKWEGTTFEDVPGDDGGPTRYGVIQTRYDQYRVDHHLAKRSVRFIEMPEVEAIYRRYYWDVIQGDNLPIPLDLAVFNCAVNSGPGRAKKWHGELKPGTPHEQARAFCDRYEQFYRGIVANRPSQRKFLRGWLNRLDDCRREIEEAQPDVEEWEVFIGTESIGKAWQNPGDAGRTYFPVRTFLLHLFSEAEVSANLILTPNGLNWHGFPVPYPIILHDNASYGRLRDMATSVGLAVEADGTKRDIRIFRPGVAKTESETEEG